MGVEIIILSRIFPMQFFNTTKSIPLWKLKIKILKNQKTNISLHVMDILFNVSLPHHFKFQQNNIARVNTIHPVVVCNKKKTVLKSTIREFHNIHGLKNFTTNFYFFPKTYLYFQKNFTSYSNSFLLFVVSLHI